jgi:hypothetical protein
VYGFPEAGWRIATDRARPGANLKTLEWRNGIIGGRQLSASTLPRQGVSKPLKSLYIMAEPARFDKWPESNNPY